MSKAFGCLAGLAIGVTANADVLTLTEAIRLTKMHNGTLKSAQQDMVAAKARLKQAQSQLLPVLTPSFTYVDSQRNVPNPQFGNQTIKFEQASTEAALSWRVIDAGQRMAQIRSSREGMGAQFNQNVQASRQVLFNLMQNYIEALRAQELEKVAASQMSRAESVLEQTKERVRVGDAPRRDVLQAQADVLNASVNKINARNRVNTNLASLKAIVGQGFQASFELTSIELEAIKDHFKSLEEAMQMGNTMRPDLLARSKNIESSKFQLRASQIDAGVTYGLDFSYNRQFSPTIGSNQNLSFVMSFPLYDGGLRRAVVEERRAGLQSQFDQYIQAQRDAGSEIEAAYLTLEQNKKRLDAAKLAREAAKLNFESAIESQKQGASDLIEVLTSQVSLVTAEANLIEAEYDTVIARLRLLLATGYPLPGEIDG
jgi:outer membrane protein